MTTAWKDRAKKAAEKTTSSNHRKKDDGESAGRKRSASQADKKPSVKMPATGSVECLFDLATNSYYTRNNSGGYQRLPKDQVTALLRRKGFSDKHRLDDGLSWVESELLDITLQRSVHYAGPLGGYQPGIYDIYSSRILVIAGPTVMKPVQGRWDHLRTFLDTLLKDQWKYFAGWLKVALRSLRAGFPWAPGQLLAVAGEGGSGKSNLQKLLTPMLGNRVSSPYEYMSSSTNFNAEIYGSEHGLIGDTNHKTDARSRRNFGAAIKKLVAEPLHYVRGMYKAPICLTPFLRLSMTCNDNDEALKVLPSIDSDVAGKIMLLKANEVDYVKLTKKFRDWPAYWAQLESELPAFVHALTRWQIPASIADKRYGIVSFKDPGLIEKLQKLTPEDNLLATIDAYIFADKHVDHWSGLAGDMVKTLSGLMTSAGESRLYTGVMNCGQQLSMLAEKYPERVTAEKIGKNRTSYLILRE